MASGFAPVSSRLNQSGGKTIKTMKTTIVFLFALVARIALHAQTPAPNWQAKAVEKYPDLALQSSALNKRFVEAVAQRRKTNPTFFTNPKWPLTLADEISNSIQTPEAKKKARAIAEINAKLPKYKMEGKIRQMTDEGAIVLASVEDSQGMLPLPDPVFVFGISRKIHVDGDLYQGTVWLAGSHRIATKTLRAFSTDREDAIKRILSEPKPEPAAAEPEPLAKPLPNPSKGGDPIETFKALSATLPKASSRKSDAEEYRIADVAFDVKKTDSLVNPIIGYLDFTIHETVVLFGKEHPTSMDFRFVFHWETDRWVFARILNRKNGKDFTNLGGGIEIIDAGPMKQFLAPFR